MNSVEREVCKNKSPADERNAEQTQGTGVVFGLQGVVELKCDYVLRRSVRYESGIVQHYSSQISRL